MTITRDVLKPSPSPRKTKAMKPICVPCQRFFRPFRTGFYFTEGMPIRAGARPGTDDADNWEDYKLWAGDKWKCQGCGAEILVGFGYAPLLVRHEPDFAKMVIAFGANTFRVNDC